MKSLPVQKLSILEALSLFLVAGCASRPAANGNKDSTVFTIPTPEMVDVSHGPGVPFGGIGTGFSVFGKYGFVDVYFDGRHLDSGDWRIDRAPKGKPSFAFQLTEDGHSTVLQQTPVAWLTNAQPVDSVKAYAHLPNPTSATGRRFDFFCGLSVRFSEGFWHLVFPKCV
jgi:hypothetical protein